MAEPDFINIAGRVNRYRGDTEIEAFSKINAWFEFLVDYIETQTIEYATKSSAVDAGTLGQMAYDDDWLYICVVEGAPGSAIWKKTAIAVAE